MEWNKNRLIDFFLENFQKEIILQKSESSLNIQGRINSVEELDLCSYSLFEVQIIEIISNSKLYITLHDRFLGIHFEIFCKESKKNKNSSREQIPYKGISISLTNKF